MTAPLVVVAILGKAGSGKDTAADHLVAKHGFIKLAFADPMKRFCREIFAFTKEQMWGPSSARNAPDTRYPRVKKSAIGEEYTDYLTPREALQQLGTNWGRNCHPDTWVKYALRIANQLTTSFVDGKTPGTHDLVYSADLGLGLGNVVRTIGGVVISDCRFLNEVKLVKEAGARVIKLQRSSGALEGAAGQHVSETEQDTIPESMFDSVVPNFGTVQDLKEQVDDLITGFRKEAYKHKVEART